MSKEENEVCNCCCHQLFAKYVESCCQICEKCGKNIKYSFMEIHKKKCLGKKGPKKD